MLDAKDVINEGLQFVKSTIGNEKASQFQRLKYDILSQTQLNQFAELLGKKCRAVSKKEKGINLKRELQTHKKTLKEAYLFFAESEEQREPLASGSEWLVDNHPFVEQQIASSESFLSEKLDRSLPKLTGGPFKGYPRIYWIAHELIEHTDAIVDDENLLSFIRYFQNSQPLLMRELWAFPTMINLVIIRRLAHLSTFNLVTRKQQLLADKFIDDLFTKPSETPSDLVIELSKRMLQNPLMSCAGTTVFLLQKLKDQGTRGALCFQWLEQKISEMGCEPSKIIEQILNLHSINQISITNCFASLRTLSVHDWKSWFEELSLVHHILKKDPANVYNISDFNTRDRCRHQIERLAEKTEGDEGEISRGVVDFASKEGKPDSALGSVCYFLIDDGIISFEKQVGYSASIADKFNRAVKKRMFGTWLSSHLAVSLLFVAVPVYYMYSLNASILLLISTFMGFSLLGTMIASQFIQWVAFYITTPRPLPKLNKDILTTEDYNTLIILHTIFRNRKSVTEAVTELEILSIANKAPYIFFALAADMSDANEKVLPEDRELIFHAKRLIEKLNKHSNRFLLITRDRSWSSSEQMFIGWERKRGKIHQINQLILGKQVDDINIEVGELSLLRSFRYVITLDEDTRIPSDVARVLIATIAHPLNNPLFKKDTSEIVRGYSIIQPTIESSLQESLRSRFSKIFASAPGMDPYTELISNTYQDLFREGSYVGKAIYDVAAFERGLGERIPENTVLSHDLLEGLFTGVGYACNTTFIDTFPTNYITFARRLHRWIRGDWQLIPWLFAKIPNAKNVLVENPISAIGRWKLLDNLLRSLVYPFSFLMIICALTFLPGNPLVWCGLVFFAINFNILLTLLNIAIIPVTHPLMLMPLFSKNVQTLKKDIAQAFFKTATIPSLAFVTGHAIVVALYRMFFSHKNLLEWTPTASLERRAPVTLTGIFKEMVPEWTLTLLFALVVAFFYPIEAVAAAPIFLLWLSAPLIVYLTNKPPYRKKTTVTLKDRRKLERIAWKTWGYFESLVTRDTHYLVPDNLQLIPHTTCAKRTSPTNIGLQLLSTLSAYDLGFILFGDLLEKTERVFHTLKKLEKCHGHLYNWYDIETLKPLHPRYVSSVDSGNLISYCITLRAALKELNELPILTPTHWKHLLLLVESDHPNFKNSKLSKTPPETLEKALSEMKEVQELRDDPRFKKERAQGLNILDSICALYEKFHCFQTLRTLYSLGTEIQKENNSSELEDLQLKLQYWIQNPKYSSIPNWVTLRNDCRQLIGVCHQAQKLYKHNKNNDAKACAAVLHSEVKALLAYCNTTLKKVHLLIETITAFINETDFHFLYSEKEHLLAIGYQVDTGVLDPNYYNLLASEASITSLVAIAKGDIPYKNWFSLGRQMVKCKSGKTLLSWSGSAFEYLMPAILIDPLPNTLLAESFRVAVEEQKRYGKDHRLPWGISESGYAATDLEGTYQYRAFGIPDLGLKRGLENDYVVSPYSTFLSLPFDLHGALKNIDELEREGAHGKYGFYEAIDYTRRRLSDGEKSYLLMSYLAHHQGMILTSINNILNKGILQNRFQKSTLIKAIDLLLQEPFPYHAKATSITRPKTHPLSRKRETVSVLKQIEKTPNTPFPHTHLLSNRKFSQMIDNSGSGFLFFEKNIAITRWSEDAQQNDYGYYIFIKDLDTNEVWSIGFQPTRAKPDYYEVVYGPEMVEFTRIDHGIRLKMEITISPEHNVEIRKLIFKNESGRRRRLEITSYGEVVLKGLNADAAHPTFSKMFIDSWIDKNFDALIFQRIPRSHDEKEMFMSHMLVASACWSRLQWETDRYNFIGRGNTIHNPQALQKNTSLSGTIGRTLDPIFSLRATLVLENEKPETISLITAVAESRSQISELLPFYFSPNSVDRTFDLSFAKSNIELRYERIPIDKIHLYQEFSKLIFFHIDPYRPEKLARMRNTLQQPSLWRYGISGDSPIVLVHLRESKQLSLVEDLLTAHHYLSLKGLNFDLIILNEVIEGYRTTFQDKVKDIIAKFGTSQNYLLHAQQLTEEEIILLEAVSNMTYGPQDEKLIPSIPLRTSELVLKKSLEKSRYIPPQKSLSDECLFFNGYGGFIDEGKAYRIFRTCPHPWSNVIGSDSFGFLITETGGGYTWSENCQSNRLTPWLPDPVSDTKGEMLYIRDSKTRKFYSPLTVPMAVCEHHFGYSRFQSDNEDFSTEVIISGSLDKKVKWWKVKITNNTESEQSLESYLVIDWLLGTLTDKSKPHLICDYDSQRQFLYVYNRYNEEFSNRIVFMGSSEDIYSFTTSRREFIGRNGDLSSPAALQTDSYIAPLGNEISTGTDSLGALHLVMELLPKEEKEFLFYLAEEDSLESARDASLSRQSLSDCNSEWAGVQKYWEEMTGKIEVKTPDPAFDILMNGWLIYQTLSSRLFAKTGYYQSSGAIGFRDQLQDAMALLAIDPSIARKQLLLHASRQFVEGDVQHWWSPQSGKGVRTRISDDYLWLPYVLLRYLEATDDRSILKEKVPYLTAEALKDNQEEAYIKAEPSKKSGTLYEHCTLAIDRALDNLGEHGLPLIGGGDWNDGMNKVGIKGKGESIWLGWFLYEILNEFKRIAEPESAEKYSKAAGTLLKNIEDFGWDGQWYRRAYFDDGTAIGSESSDECKIDSIAQSWSVIADSGNKARQEEAILSAIKYLVNKKDSLISLLTPPFEKTLLEPGYIKFYPPGVRENGGQYTHAAAWLILATAQLGKGNKAFELFQMINPIYHTLNEKEAEKYFGEPYVLAGDVYSEAPLNGQAGWTWYTGAAGWIYYIGLETVLGLKIRDDYFTVDPCISSEWKSFSMRYRERNSTFDIRISNPDNVEKGVLKILVDGKEVADKKIPLPKKDSKEQKIAVVEVIMGRTTI